MQSEPTFKSFLARNTAARVAAVAVALAGTGAIGAVVHASAHTASPRITAPVAFSQPSVPDPVDSQATPYSPEPQPVDVTITMPDPVAPAPDPAAPAPDPAAPAPDPAAPAPDYLLDIDEDVTPVTPVTPAPTPDLISQMDSDGDGQTDLFDDTPYQDNYGDPDGDGIETQYDESPSYNDDYDLDGITNSNDYEPDSYNTDPGDDFDMEPNQP